MGGEHRDWVVQRDATPGQAQGERERGPAGHSGAGTENGVEPGLWGNSDQARDQEPRRGIIRPGGTTGIGME